MSWAKLAVVRATAAVFVADRRAGSAVLVDDRHLVTARHVLLRRDPATGSKEPVEQAEVEFPGAGPEANPRTLVTRLDLGIAANGVDISVLQLGQPLLKESRPVPVWPAGRLPERVAVFGYPLAEGPLSGVWREFTVAGPTTSMTVQLDWETDVGTFPGHSGGPVIAARTGELVGILIEGFNDGRFDRFVPVPLIAQLWPQLRRRWLMTGPEGRSHFERRARGLQSRTRGGDLFRGRRAALAAVHDWLTASDSSELPLIITGQPGAGKSSTLARSVLAFEAEGVDPGLAFHARDATDTDLLDAVADLAGLDHGMSRDALVDALRDADRSRPWRVAVDAVDEAATAQARRRIVETLSELAELPQTRVVVATRAVAVSERERYLPGSLLYGLGVTGADSLNSVDLDSDRYFDSADLAEFAAAMLAQDGIEHPGPEGRAWAYYRAHPAVRRRLARVIARRADRNYLVAAMSAHRLSRAREPRDPADPGFDEREVEAGVGDALSKYLDGLPDTERGRMRALLVALAYARGAGVNDALWLGFAAALGYPVSAIDLDHLRASAAADYLL
ncbi:MAG: trypsin-like peptidase domain-containing protein, partial [Pseudonocardiaceae bacterium]